MRSISDIPWTVLEASYKPWNAGKISQSDVIYSFLLDRFAHQDCNIQLEPTLTAKEQTIVNERVGGTLNGATENLRYIKELGVTTILINPFLQNQSSSYHGYAIIDFLHVDKQLGTTEDLIRFVEVAHSIGIKVLFDCVLNHAGDVFSYYASNSIYNQGVNYTVKKWNEENDLLPIELKDFNLFERKGHIQHWEIKEEATQGDIFELKTFIQNPITAPGKFVLESMSSIYLYWALITNVDGYRIDALKHLHPKFIESFVNTLSEKLIALGKIHFNFLGEYIYKNAQSVTDQYAIDLLNYEFYFFVNQLNKQKVKLNADKLQFLFLENHDQIGLYPKQRFNYKKSTQEQYIWWRFLSLIPHSVPIYYYGSEQGLQGIGSLDASVREPLFDLASKTTWLNQQSIGYQVLKSILGERKVFNNIELNESYEIENKENIIIGVSAEGSYKLFFNSTQVPKDISRLLFENNLSIHKKNVYLFQDDSYKEFLGVDVEVVLPPLSILLITNRYE